MASTVNRPRALVLDREDSVAVLLDPVANGEAVMLLDSGSQALGTVKVSTPIEPFHKIAIRGIGQGEHVIKYGEVIGRASRSILRGDHVHIHNVESVRLSRGSR